MRNGSLTAPDPTRIADPIQATSRVAGAIVVKKGNPPVERFRRGRAGRWAKVYETIQGMRGDEWFEVPDSRGMMEKDRIACVSAIRKWLTARSHDAKVYINEHGGVTVRA